MKVIHLVSDLDEKYGGPSQSVPYLVAHLAKLGVEGEIVYSRLEPEMRNDIVREHAIKATGVPVTFSRNLYYSADMRHVLRRAIADRADFVHIHSMWRLPAWQAFTEARRAGIPHVVSPRSNLYAASLKRSRYVKQGMRKAFVDRMIETAAFVHATDPSESEAVRAAGYRDVPVTVIPNGLPEAQVGLDRDQARQILDLPSDDDGGQTVLFLSRVDQRKRVEDLICAFGRLHARHPRAKLIIAGPCNDPTYRSKLDQVVAGCGAQDAIRFAGMLHGREKAAAYASSDIFVLPSEFENFGIAVGEALSYGLPVLTTTGTPWLTLEQEGAGWVVPPRSPDQLGEKLQIALSLTPDQRDRMTKATTAMARRYSWSSVAEAMKVDYERHIARRETP